MNPKHQYHLLAVSNAQIGNTAEGKLKGAWLIETCEQIELEVAKAKAKQDEVDSDIPDLD